VISTCDACNEAGKYNDQFDSYYCEKCDIWIENFCINPTCMFCADRPEKPSLGTKENE